MDSLVSFPNGLQLITEIDSLLSSCFEKWALRSLSLYLFMVPNPLMYNCFSSLLQSLKSRYLAFELAAAQGRLNELGALPVPNSIFQSSGPIQFDNRFIIFADTWTSEEEDLFSDITTSASATRMCLLLKKMSPCHVKW